MSKFQVSTSEDGMRLDQWIKGRFPHLSTAVFFNLFKKKQVKLNGQRPEPKHRVQEGDELVFFCKEISQEPQSQKSLVQEMILAQSHGLVILNKPAGLAVHPGAGQSLGASLVEILEREWTAPAPKLVHRLDQGTSGVLLLAENDAALADALGALRSHTLCKRYLALVAGNPGIQGEIDLSLDFSGGREGRMQVGKGKKALTLWWNQQTFEHPELGTLSLLKVEPWTGRMHQIRTHLAHLGHPLLGDPRYGDFALSAKAKKSLGLKRMFLHAWKLNYPGVGEWEAPLAPELQKVVENLAEHQV